LNAAATSSRSRGFSALQRAEIAEIVAFEFVLPSPVSGVSVLFNEPKLLKLAPIFGALLVF